MPILTIIGIQFASGAYSYKKSKEHGEKMQKLQQEFKAAMQRERGVV